MSVSAPIGTQEVSSSMINEPKNTKRNLWYEVMNPVESELEQYECAEEILPGNAITISPDGKAHNACSLADNVKPVLFMAFSGGAIGEFTTIKRSGEKLRVPGATFVPGKKVWLSFGSPNITTTMPAIVRGNILQCLGRTVNATDIELLIEEFYFL